MLANEKVLAAALESLYRGLVAIRNESLSGKADIKLINSLSEAMHEVPRMVQQVEYYTGGEAEMLSHLRCHLAGFDGAKFPGFPNLLKIFDGKLAG